MSDGVRGNNQWVIFIGALVVSLAIAYGTTAPELRQQAFFLVFLFFAAALLFMLIYPQFAVVPIVL